jgi:MATE family multidrug resistance protein
LTPHQVHLEQLCFKSLRDGQLTRFYAVILSYVLQNGIQSASILIAGWLGPDELSAAAFSMMLAFVTG